MKKLFLGPFDSQTGHPYFPCFLREILGIKD